MCGLLGMFGPMTADDGVARLTDAVRSLYHRGPDETEIVSGDGYVLGFQRLAIVDPAGSHQPLSYPPSGPDAGRYVIASNCEIYNHVELRRTLTEEYGASFATEGDAEVIAAAHYYWGATAPEHLRGMFAYVVWDRLLGRVTGARDRFGIKPLYYLATPDGLVDWADGIMAGSGAKDLLNLEYARGLLRAHRRGEADHSRKVWTVLVFCLWYGLFVDRTIDPGPVAPSLLAHQQG